CPGVCGGRHRTSDRAVVSAVLGVSDYVARVGTGRAGSGGGGDNPDTPGPDHLAGHGDRGVTNVHLGFAGRGLWERRRGWRGPACTSRSNGSGGEEWRTFLGGRATSAPGSAPDGTGRNKANGRSGDALSAVPSICP